MSIVFFINIISSILQIIKVLIIIRVILSWININSYNQYIRIVVIITEPILVPFRNIISSFNIGFDISPLIAIIALDFIRNFLISIIIHV